MTTEPKDRKLKVSDLSMDSKRSIWRKRWVMPAYILALGALVFAAFAIGGDATQGAYSFGFMAIAALAVFIASGRSETMAGISGPGRDERWQRIDRDATAYSGAALILVLIGCWLYELADGQDGEPYTQLLAVGGLSYIAALAYLRWRS